MPHIAPRRALAAACLAAFACAAGAQAMYKWVDEKGTTHFSEHPPPDGRKASKVEPKVTPPSAPAAASRDNPQKWREQEADFRKRQLERSQREQADAQESAERAAQCSDARRRLAHYESMNRIFDTKEDGTRVYYNEAQREAFIARLRETVKDRCG